MNPVKPPTMNGNAFLLTGFLRCRFPRRVDIKGAFAGFRLSRFHLPCKAVGPRRMDLGLGLHPSRFSTHRDGGVDSDTLPSRKPKACDLPRLARQVVIRPGCNRENWHPRLTAKLAVVIDYVVPNPLLDSIYYRRIECHKPTHQSARDSILTGGFVV